MTVPNSERPLLYNIYEYPEFRGGGSVWGDTLSDFGDGPPLISVPLDDRGNAELTRPLYFEVWRPRRQIGLPPGSYSSNFTTGIDSRMEYGYETGDNCNEAPH